MEPDHARFAELAVGHVLGGLNPSDARRFQGHLEVGVEGRTRVAELRDIASDLAAAEQDERTRSPVKTEVSSQAVSRADRAAGATPTRRMTVGHVTVAALVVVVLAVGMMFWNLHLRTQVSGYQQLLEAQSEALSILATGVELEPELAEGVTAVVAFDGAQLAVTLGGMQLASTDLVSTWRLDAAGEATEVARAPAAMLDHGTMSAVVEIEDGVEVLITQEPGVPAEEGPEGEVLVRVELGPDP